MLASACLLRCLRRLLTAALPLRLDLPDLLRVEVVAGSNPAWDPALFHLQVTLSLVSSLAGFDSQACRVLRDITALFFRLLLKKTVLSQSEGPDYFYSLPPRAGPSHRGQHQHRWFSGKINGCQSEERARLARVPL